MANIIDTKLEGINAGLIFRVFEGTSTEQIVCSDCKAWEHFNGQSTNNLRHSKRCDFPKLQYRHVVEVAEAKEAVETKLNANFTVDSTRTDSEVFDAYQRGYISSDDAMNRDF